MTPLASFLSLALLLLPLVLVAEAELENCPTTESLLQEVCSFDVMSETAAAFRNETRFNHNVTDKGDSKSFSCLVLLFSKKYPFSADADTLAGVTLFSLDRLHTVNCRPSCHGVERENVTWCVRFFYVGGYLETCLSLGEDNQPVFQSTCDTSALNLEDHLSLPTVSYSQYNACLFVNAPL